MNESKVVAEKNFPKHTIGMVTQSGSELTERQTGVTVKVYAREGKAPHFAEVYDTETEGDGHYAEIGLTIENKALVDYDGCFSCPTEVLDMLKEMGFDVSECEV